MLKKNNIARKHWMFISHFKYFLMLKKINIA